MSRMNRAPFIATQRISLLKGVDGEEQLDSLHGLNGRSLSLGGTAVKKSDEDPLRSLTEYRESFLGRLHHQRLILTETGGIGKTTALEQLGYLRSVHNPGHVCLLVEAAELPEAAEGILAVSERAEDAAKPSLLVRRFRQVGAGQEMSGKLIWRLLQRKIRQGQFSLLVDALDQVDLTPDSLKLRALASFLVQHRTSADPDCGIYCVVTGRPYAISHYWSELIAAGDWRIAAMAPFTDKEQKRYLSEERWKKLRNLKADVLSVPRALEQLRVLPKPDLANLHTAADVYRESIRSIISRGVKKQATTIDETEAIRWFAMLAFEMLRQGRFVDVAPGAEFDEFLLTLYRHRRAWLSERYNIESFEGLRMKLTELNRLNIVIDNAVTETRNVTRLRWHNRTLQDFFAAIWCTRHNEDSDREWLISNNRPDAAGDAKYSEFWRLLCDMPRYTLNTRGRTRPIPDADVFDAESYVQAVAGAFTVEGRSTEVIYLSWPRLTEIAAYREEELGQSLPHRPSEQQIDQFNAALQQYVYAAVDRGGVEWATREPLNHDVSKSQLARVVLENYLSQFPLIIQGKQGEAFDQSIAEDLHLEGFGDLIEPGPFAKAGVTPGDSGDLAEIKQPYRLSRTVVTKGQYSLFQPEFSKASCARCKHGISGEGYETQHPAVEVSWYDAWAAALWLHSALPEEDEWECASRGRKHRCVLLEYGITDNHLEVEDNEIDYEREEIYARMRYSGLLRRVNEGWGVATSEGQLQDQYGLRQMLGNVGEWMQSSNRDGYRRVSGGSDIAMFIGLAPQLCTVSSFYTSAPGLGGFSIGFRLVRRGAIDAISSEVRST
ncbi:Formylglycine-generating sulfatase enzyme [Planctomycetes bacterium MalM25]|nr:Formylglycine-generating sulfatase enzyme [Planctomycetes bacterium MalM25]